MLLQPHANFEPSRTEGCLLASSPLRAQDCSGWVTVLGEVLSRAEGMMRELNLRDDTKSV